MSSSFSSSLYVLGGLAAAAVTTGWLYVIDQRTLKRIAEELPMLRAMHTDVLSILPTTSPEFTTMTGTTERDVFSFAKEAIELRIRNRVRYPTRTPILRAFMSTRDARRGMDKVLLDIFINDDGDAHPSFHHFCSRQSPWFKENFGYLEAKVKN
jgi:hypothetical protein